MVLNPHTHFSLINSPGVKFKMINTYTDLNAGRI
jgi:hypothetical protein